jgi:hypothetical protein
MGVLLVKNKNNTKLNQMMKSIKKDNLKNLIKINELNILH